MNKEDILKLIKSIIIFKQKNNSSEQIIYSNADEEACPGLVEQEKIIS